MSALRELAEKTARKAGRLLKDRAGSEGDVVTSVGHDIKLRSDRASESLILESLKSAGGIPALTEESGVHGDIEGAEDLWIVDPLDGSLNFNRGIPLVCASIALWRNGSPHMGVVYDFERDELFSAEKGEGAWMNGSPMRVSSIKRAPEGVLCTGFPSKSRMDDESMLRFTGRARSFKKVRMLGAAALMLSWVACGRADAYAEEDIMLWDVAAGLALVECAGGWIDIRKGSAKWQLDVRAASASPLFTGSMTEGQG